MYWPIIVFILFSELETLTANSTQSTKLPNVNYTSALSERSGDHDEATSPFIVISYKHFLMMAAIGAAILGGLVMVAICALKGGRKEDESRIEKAQSEAEAPLTTSQVEAGLTPSMIAEGYTPSMVLRGVSPSMAGQGITPSLIQSQLKSTGPFTKSSRPLSAVIAKSDFVRRRSPTKSKVVHPPPNITESGVQSERYVKSNVSDIADIEYKFAAIAPQSTPPVVKYKPRGVAIDSASMSKKRSSKHRNRKQ
ncbi:hypothetical protein HDE_10911 [Halotydeus destructor]|nr:hypothetical protein HDE_10911 [Halotydeus destructor]